jgi:hypothetical protein
LRAKSPTCGFAPPTGPKPVAIRLTVRISPMQSSATLALFALFARGCA